MRQSKAQRRAAWMADMETILLGLAPDQAGRIDWDTAAFHFNSGRSSSDAAHRMAGIEIVGFDSQADFDAAVAAWNKANGIEG